MGLAPTETSGIGDMPALREKGQSPAARSGRGSVRSLASSVAQKQRTDRRRESARAASTGDAPPCAPPPHHEGRSPHPHRRAHRFVDVFAADYP